MERVEVDIQQALSFLFLFHSMLSSASIEQVIFIFISISIVIIFIVFIVISSSESPSSVTEPPMHILSMRYLLFCRAFYVTGRFVFSISIA